MKCLMQNDLASHYLVDDLPGAVCVGARLHGILAKIDLGGPVSKFSQDFLGTHGLKALHALSSHLIDRVAYQEMAAVEREERLELAFRQAAERSAMFAERATQRDAALKAHFAAMAADPKFRRQRESKDLRARYKIGYVETEHYPRVMSLLRRVSSGQPLRPEDLLWLQTEADYCWTDELKNEWHTLEAKAHTAAWQKGGDPWDAINGSGHWRKAGKPDLALSLTEAALAKGGTTAKIRSALETTRGGALRDLHRLEDAKALGLNAHQLTPADFRPCTLLGAVHIELGDLVSGHRWYVKAEKLGADRRAVDQDLRALITRASKSEQRRICEFLLDRDPGRFSWLRSR